MRPADRNCAVSVEIGSDGSCVLKADIRNAFEDDPSLEGGIRMQQQFINTLEMMDLG